MKCPSHQLRRCIPYSVFQTDDPPSEPDSTLINGKGRYSGGRSVPLSVVNVLQGKRSVLHLSLRIERGLHVDTRGHNSYRLRLVSISCDPWFNFSIDGHQLTVIEVDGTNVNPLQVDSLQIFAGMTI